MLKRWSNSGFQLGFLRSKGLCYCIICSPLSHQSCPNKLLARLHLTHIRLLDDHQLRKFRINPIKAVSAFMSDSRQVLRLGISIPYEMYRAK